MRTGTVMSCFDVLSLPRQQRHDQTSEALGFFVVRVARQAESAATRVDELQELRGHLLRIANYSDARTGTHFGDAGPQMRRHLAADRLRQFTLTLVGDRIHVR